MGKEIRPPSQERPVMTTKPSPNAIAHDGGPCPVAPETRVRVWFRDCPTEYVGAADKWGWKWYSRFHSGTDILFYEPLDAPTVKADECDLESQNDFVSIMGALTDYIENERVRAFNKGVDASPPAPMPVVDEAMVDRALTAARGNDDWLGCPDGFKHLLRDKMTRAIKAALTPPSSAMDK